MATSFHKVTNNAQGQILASSISSTSLTIPLATGDGAEFPSSGLFWVTMEHEIAECNGRSGDTLTVASTSKRGVQGTVATSHDANTYVELLYTAGHLQEIHTAINTLESSVPENLYTPGDLTVKGNTFFGDFTSATSIEVDSADATSIELIFKKGDITRWEIEPGDINNNFKISAYDDIGEFIDTPIDISNDGDLTINRALVATSGINIPTGQTYKVNGVPLALSHLSDGAGLLTAASNIAITGIWSFNEGLNIATGKTYKINNVQISSAALSNDSNLAKIDGNHTITGTYSFSNGLNIATGQTYKVNGTQISSANLSNDSNLCKLNGTHTITGTYTFNTGMNIASGQTYKVNGTQISSANLSDAASLLTTSSLGTAIADALLDSPVIGSGPNPAFLITSNLTELDSIRILKQGGGTGNEHYGYFKAGSTLTNNRVYTFGSDENGYVPAIPTVGTLGQVLTSDGDGTYSWSTPSSGGATSLNGLSDVTITGGSAGHILVRGASVYANVAMSGDVTMSSTGVTTIGAGKVAASNIVSGTITATQIADTTITGAKIAATTIAAGNIVSGTITATQIADTTITGAKIANATITGGKIAATTIAGSNMVSGTVTATQIADTTITGAKLANDTITATQLSNVVTAGTYNRVQVDATGRVITGTTANTTKAIILTAAGGTPAITGGCTAPTQAVSSSNAVNYWNLPFSANGEIAWYNVVLPADYGGGTLTVAFYWISEVASGTVQWGIAGGSYSNNELINTAIGTEVTNTAQTVTGAGKVNVVASSTALTLANTPSGNDIVAIRIRRVAGTLSGIAAILAVKLEYTPSIS